MIIPLKEITIYTDGACAGNPGIGGWGAILIWHEYERELSGSSPLTTNNKMELTAAIEAIKQIRERCKLKIYTDSVYLRDGITKWLSNWQKNHWKTSNNKPVKNIELWQELSELQKEHEIEWHWVKGHNGNELNERVDRLARNAIKEFKDSL